MPFHPRHAWTSLRALVEIGGGKTFKMSTSSALSVELTQGPWSPGSFSALRSLLPASRVHTNTQRRYSSSDLAHRRARKGKSEFYKKRCDLEGLTICPVSADDLEAVWRMWRSEGFDGDLEQLQDLQRHLAPDTFMCAKVNGILAGAVATVLLTPQLAMQCALIVAPGHRGQGLGRHLIREGRGQAGFRCNVVADATEDMAGPYRAWDWDVQTYVLRDYHGTIQPEQLAELAGQTSPNQDVTVVALEDKHLDMVRGYDEKIHPLSAKRFRYFESYFKKNTCYIAVAKSGTDTTPAGLVLGYGVVSALESGYYLGPIYADDDRVAVALMSSLTGHIPRSSGVRMYIPDINAQARSLAEALGLTPEGAAIRVHDLEPIEMNMQHVFGCSYASYVGFLMC